MANRTPGHQERASTGRGVVVAHTGVNASTRELLVALDERDLLDRFVTTVGFSEGGRPARAALALGGPARALAQTRLVPLPPSRISYHPPFEVVRLAANRLGPAAGDRVWERGDWWFSRRVAALLRGGGGGLVAFEHLALEAFQRAERLGVPTVHRTVALHHQAAREIYRRQRDLFPDLFQGQMAAETGPHTARRDRRKQEELRLAGAVVCNTSFIRRTLVEGGVPEAKVRVVPYGFPEAQPSERRGRGGAKTVFLHAGSLSIIKGTPYVVEAWRRLAPPASEAELWLVGANYIGLDPETLPGTVRAFGRVPRARLLDLYAEASVLVFPSLGEGFGLVLAEAMSRGLAAVTTDRTAACDFVADGENGWVVEAESVDSLAEAMEARLRDPDGTAAAGAAAAETARSWTWADHRQLMAETVAELTVERRS